MEGAGTPNLSTLGLIAYRAGGVVHRAFPMGPAGPRAPLVIQLEHRRLFGAVSVVCYCCGPFESERRRVDFLSAALATVPFEPAAFTAVAQFRPAGSTSLEPERLIEGVDSATLANVAHGPLLAVVELGGASIGWAVAGDGGRAAETARLELTALFERFVLLEGELPPRRHAI